MSNANNLLIARAIMSLKDAYNLLEGQYSNIPNCCIEGYIKGRTWSNVRNSIPEKEVKKLSKWHYVPCEKCYESNNINKLKTNGTSDLGKIIFSLIEILENRKKEQRNERKSNKRSKK